MNHYVEVRAKVPNADFHYMGHSNGTYLCARALLDYPATAFSRIMFAGSVVHQSFPWRELMKWKRVSKVYNGVATGDWVVALFPNGLRYLKGVFDLGGAGHTGFNVENQNRLLNFDYVEGDHSASRVESQWAAISSFIVNEQFPKMGSNHPSYKCSQPLWIKFLGFFSPVFILIIAIAVLGIGLKLAIVFFTSFFVNQENMGPGIYLLGMLIYLLVIRFLALKY
ncbi:hypothetical protein AB833_18760 [Chromatiales bacterium (ex Bugula neritina AB1)]|nr:hypothetical protein AB833_18760 [Chromatiales bacterium (ex Bugula neritina AB1)]